MIVYDIETLCCPDEVEGGWKNPNGMGFGCAVSYDDKRDLYNFWSPGQQEGLIAHLKSTSWSILTFNGVRFDNAVLLGNTYKSPWNDCDLLLNVVREKFGVATVAEAEEKVGSDEVHDGSIGLDGLAWGTLRRLKIGESAAAPKLIQQGKWAEVYAYCLHDVRLLLALYRFAAEHGFLVDKKDRIIRFPAGLRVVDGERS